MQLPEIMRWLKTATAARANRLIGRNGLAFWKREYYDHWIRTEQELRSIIAYVEQNRFQQGLWKWPRTGHGPARPEWRRRGSGTSEVVAPAILSPVE